jgi:tRNA(Arg) A34 adenosine deaminase TadA
MCFGAAMSFGLGEVHYALESPGDGAAGLVRHRVQQHHGAPRRRAIELFGAYAARHPPGGMREWAATLAAR